MNILDIPVIGIVLQLIGYLVTVCTQNGTTLFIPSEWGNSLIHFADRIFREPTIPGFFANIVQYVSSKGL